MMLVISKTWYCACFLRDWVMYTCVVTFMVVRWCLVTVMYLVLFLNLVFILNVRVLKVCVALVVLL